MTFFADHGADGAIRKWRLYYLGLATPIYWTDHTDFDIEWDGHTWTAQPITPGPINNQPDGAAATFKIGDADNTLFPVLLAANGAELALAEIYEAGFLLTNKTAAPDEVLQIFSGRVDRAGVLTDEEDSIEFVLMPPALTSGGEVPTRLISTLLRS